MNVLIIQEKDGSWKVVNYDTGEVRCRSWSYPEVVEYVAKIQQK